jgi:hypothetical protein
VVLSLGDILPGLLLDGSFNPVVQVPGDVAYSFAVFQALVNSVNVTATLMPSIGTELAVGDFALITIDESPVTGVPEPSSLLLGVAGLALLLRKRQKAALLVLACALLPATQPAVAQSITPITLSATTSPAAGQPNVTTMTLTGSGFPTGTINLNQLTITMTPVVLPGTAMTATPTAIATVAGSTRRITFRFSGADLAAAANYNIAISGATATGQNFASTTPSRIVVNPPATVTLSPSSATAGTQRTVSLTGAFTNFVNGSTSANFGPGIAVGAAAAGVLEKVTVTSPTAATASISIAANAAPGARQVTISTGVQTSTATFTVNASAPTNLPPTANPGANQTSFLNTVVDLDGSASTDPEQQALSYQWTLTGRPAGSTAALINPASSKPNLGLDRVGAYTAQLIVSDGQLSSAPAQVVITVPVNGPPVLSPVANRTLALGTTLELRLSATDPDPKDVLTYSLTNAPSGGALTPTPLLKWKPTSSQLGNNSFTARVQDNNGNFDTKTFSVNVVNTNGAPLFDPQPDETISRGATFSRMLNALDPNPTDTLIYSLVSGPSGMILIPAQRLSWTPTIGQIGDFPVRVRVVDPAGLTAFAQFTVTVKNTLTPTAVDDRYEISLGQTLVVPAPGVLGNDINPNPGPLSAAKLSDPDKGSATLASSGALSYQAPSLPIGPILDVTRRAAGPGQIVDYNLSAPILADFTGDGKPEVIWFNGNSLMVNRGDNGALLLIITRPPSAQTLGLSCQIGNGNRMGPVAADIDDDGIVEIVVSAACLGDPGLGGLNSTTAERIAALVYDSTAVEGYRVKWISANRLAQSANGNGIGVGSIADSALTVARLRPTDKPMILFGVNFPNGLGGRCADVRPGTTDAVCRVVFAVNTADGSLNRIYYSSHPFMVGGSFADLTDGYMAPLVADVDNDGVLEILYQGTLWNLDGTVKRQLDGFDVPGGNGVTYSMVLDVDGDPEMEIITQNNRADTSFTSRQATGLGYLKAFKANGTLLWSLGIPVPQALVTAMTAADVDRDGIPEIIFAIYQSIWVVDSRTGQIRYIKSLVTSDPASAVIDTSRGAPTFPVYDLNGDGILDMVVQWGASTVRILRADNGAEQTLFTYPGNAPYSRFSDGRPQPVIADTDGSGQASIVWIHDVNLNGHSNLQVITGNTVPWRSAPANYNQQAFWGSNFNANGSIPFTYPRHTTNPRTNIFRNQPPAPYPSGFTGAEQTRFTYSASSDGLSSAPANVVIDIARNRKPQFTSIPPSVKVADQPLVYLATAVDPDPGDTITYALVSRFGPNASDCCSQIVVDPSTGRTTFTARHVLAGEVIVLSATDNQGATAYQTFTLNVVNSGATVPNIVGLSQAAAATALSNAQLALGTVNTTFNSAPVGTVLSQSPSANATLPQTERVHVTVSKGLAPIAVPNVVSQASSSATTTLSSLGFTSAITNVFSDTVGRGEVISQVPVAGTVATPPGPVALTVSAGNGLALRLSRDLTTADAAIPFTIAATDLNGLDIAAPPMTFAVTVLRTPTAGPLPSLVGSSIVPSTATRGVFRLTATHTATGRSVFADFAVTAPRPADGESMMDDFVKLSEAMADIDVLIRQGKSALAANNEPLMRSLLTQMVTRWRQVNQSDLKFDTPFAPETGFFPTPEQFASFGDSPTPDDQLLAQIRADSIADLKEWTDAILTPGTPLSTLRALADKFGTRASRANGLVASESGLIQDQAAIAVLLNRRIPALYDAIFSEIALGLGLPPAIQPLGAEPVLEHAQSASSPKEAASLKEPGHKEATLAELLVRQGLEYLIDKVLDDANLKLLAAKKYTKDLMIQAGYAAAAVAITQHLRTTVQGQDIDAVVSGASLSFRVFAAPYAMIEANIEKRNPDLNAVFLIGPTILQPLQPLILKIQEAAKFRKTLNPNDPDRYTDMNQIKKDLKSFRKKLEEVAASGQEFVDTVKNAYQPTLLSANQCVFTTAPRCGELLYPDGFKSVYVYKAPPALGAGFTGIPLPIVFMVYNAVTGEFFFDTPPFFSTDK